MSEANRVAVRIVEEAVLGTTPATPEFEELCITAAPDLAFTPLTTESQKLKSNRKTDDLPLVGAEAGGSVSHEVGARIMETLLEGAMFSVWDNKAFRENVSAGGDIDSVSATAYTIVDPGIEGDSNGKDFAQYMLIRTAGFVAAANNGIFEVDTGATTTNVPVLGGGLTVDASPAIGASVKQVGFKGVAGDLDLSVTAGAGSSNALTSTLIDFTTLGLVPGEWVKVGNGTAANSFTTTGLTDGFWARIDASLVIAATELIFDRVPTLFAAEASTTETISVACGDRLVEGIVKKSYSIEEEFGDIVNLYQYFEGMVVEQMEFTFDTQAIVGATTTFQGTNGFFMNTGRIAGATTVVPSFGDLLNTSSNVPRVGEGGLPVTTPNIVQSGGITINNNLRRINGVGRIGAYDIGAGRSVITGNLATIFGDETLAEKVINNTETSFDVVFESTNDGTALLFDAPRTKYSEGAVTVPGIDQDNTVPLSFQALEHATLAYQLLVQRFIDTV